MGRKPVSQKGCLHCIQQITIQVTFHPTWHIWPSHSFPHFYDSMRLHNVPKNIKLVDHPSIKKRCDISEMRMRGRLWCNSRTRSRGWQRGLVLTWWQVRGWAPDCYHWLWFQHSVPSQWLCSFFCVVSTCVLRSGDWHSDRRCQRRLTGVNQTLVTSQFLSLSHTCTRKTLDSL